MDTPTTTQSAPDSVPVRLSLAEGAFLIGAPLAWAVLLWFHPAVARDNVYGDLRDEVVTYVIVHTGTLVFIGLMGLALYRPRRKALVPRSNGAAVRGNENPRHRVRPLGVLTAA
jgi:hypothetical protein